MSVPTCIYTCIHARVFKAIRAILNPFIEIGFICNATEKIIFDT